METEIGTLVIEIDRINHISPHQSITRSNDRVYNKNKTGCVTSLPPLLGSTHHTKYMKQHKAQSTSMQHASNDDNETPQKERSKLLSRLYCHCHETQAYGITHPYTYARTS